MPRYCQGSLPGAQLSNVLLKPKRETETASISPEGVLRQQTISNQTQKPVSLEAQSVCSMPSSHLHTSAHVCTPLLIFTSAARVGVWSIFPRHRWKTEEAEAQHQADMALV